MNSSSGSSSSSQSRGRGRGRGKNLPAWITQSQRTASSPAPAPAPATATILSNDIHYGIDNGNGNDDKDMSLVATAEAKEEEDLVAKEEEEELKRLEALLNGNHEKKQEEEETMARKRREARKRRLQQLASRHREEEEEEEEEEGEKEEQQTLLTGNASASASMSGRKRSHPDESSHTATSSSSSSSPPLSEKKQSQVEMYENDPHGRGEGGGGGGNENDHAVIPVDGHDSFDIFSTSISPPTPKKIQENVVNQSGPAQQNQNGILARKAAATTSTTTTAAAARIASLEMDDAEGYYRATIGEIIRFSLSNSQKEEHDSIVLPCFRVSGIIGKGVFSTVLKCVGVVMDGDNMADVASLDSSGQQQQSVVAIKLIRSNETMAKAAQKEVRILRLLHATSTTANTTRNKGSCTRARYIVKLLDLQDLTGGSKSNILPKESSSMTNTYYPSTTLSSTQHLLEYHNHTALLFEYMPFNLRETLSKFGKNVGINLTAVRSYAKQLLMALQHLEDHRVVHADIKLDNILVSSDFSTVKLCDFGSAFFETDVDNDPTPYLVSRFYRAPEIILGMKYDKKIDLWSVAVSMAELFTGRVLFPGINNNDMLRRFMEAIGPFSNKMIRRHILSFQQMGLDPHFEASVAGGSHFNFKRQEVDKVSGKPVIRVMSASGGVAVASKQMTSLLLRCRSASDGRADVILFGEFLSRCLALDPQKRPSVDDMLSHGFFSGGEKKAVVDKVVVRS
jgi:Serine/threonine protein kinase